MHSRHATKLRSIHPRHGSFTKPSSKMMVQSNLILWNHIDFPYCFFPFPEFALSSAMEVYRESESTIMQFRTCLATFSKTILKIQFLRPVLKNKQLSVVFYNKIPFENLNMKKGCLDLFSKDTMHQHIMPKISSLFCVFLIVSENIPQKTPENTLNLFSKIIFYNKFSKKYFQLKITKRVFEVRKLFSLL